MKKKTNIPFSDIICEPNRKTDAVSDKALLSSISEIGLIEPIVLYGLNPDGKFKVVAGRRRFAALKALKREDGELTPDEYTLTEGSPDVVAATENMNRLDMSQREKVEAAVALRKDNPDMTLKELAAACGCAPETAARRLTVGSLPSEFVALLDDEVPLSRLEEFATLPECVRKEYEPSHLRWNNCNLSGKKLPDGCGWDEFCAECPKNSRNVDPDLFGDEDRPCVCYDSSCYRKKNDAAIEEAVREYRRNPDAVVVAGRYNATVSEGRWLWDGELLETQDDVDDKEGYEEHCVLYIPDEGRPEPRTVHYRPEDVRGAEEPVAADPTAELLRELNALETRYQSSVDVKARELMKARYQTVADFPAFTRDRVAKAAIFYMCNPEWHAPFVDKVKPEDFMAGKVPDDKWMIPLFQGWIDRYGLDGAALFNVDKSEWIDIAKRELHPSERLVELRRQARKLGM